MGDLPDFSRRLTEKAIAYAESSVGPMNLYAFNFLSLEDDTTSPPTYANNGLYWSTKDSVIGGDSLAGAGYRLSLKHFNGGASGGRDLLDLGSNSPGSVEGVYDERYDAYFIVASNSATTASKLFFDLSSLALPAGSLATVIEVDAQHHGDAQSGERWSDVTNLRPLAHKSKYAEITDNALQFVKAGQLDPDLRVAGTAVTSPGGLLRVDVTDYLREQAALGHSRVSLLLVREVNRHLETIAYSASFRSRESDCGAPSLTMRLFK